MAALVEEVVSFYFWSFSAPPKMTSFPSVMYIDATQAFDRFLYTASQRLGLPSTATRAFNSDGNFFMGR